MKLPATALPFVPCPVIQTPANVLPLMQVSLARVVDSIAVGPDRVVAGSAVDLDPVLIRRGLSAGRVGAQEIAVDPVAGGSGPGDVDAGAL